MSHSKSSIAHRSLRGLMCALLLATLPVAGEAQLLRGKLLDANDDRPIRLGLILLSTTDGDSIDATLTDDDGDFRVEAPDSGSFLLTGAALGYRESVTGVFDLGDGSSMTVEFRLAPQPLTLEGLLVNAPAYATVPELVSNGFYRRMQRGFGHFMTPEDIEKSMALNTSDLFYGIPGVRVSASGAFLDDIVTVRGGGGVYCQPEIFLDGARVQLMTDRIEELIPLETISAVEVYSGVAAVPLEYTTQFGGCGVLLFWSKS